MKTSKIKLQRPKSLIATLLTIFLIVCSFVLTSLEPVRLPQGNGPIEFYCNQANDDLRGTVLSAIDSAQQSIMLAVYSLNDQKVIKALKNKAADGIDVSVIVDAKAAPHARKALGSQVKTTLRAPLGLMHLKILVVDSAQVWIGTANMSYDSLRTHGNLIIGLDNPYLASVIDDYLSALRKTGPPNSTQPKPIAFTQDHQEGDLWFFPDPSGNALRTLLHTLHSAKDTLKIAMFTWTHPALTDAVIAAHNRGVDVTVVIDSNQGSATGAQVVRDLKAAGVPTYLSRGKGLLHYKMAIIDDAVLVVGSANWTRSACTKNDDCFLILQPLTATQQEHLRRSWSVILHESDRGLF
jgi:phosphatidylserine/phosphatidylglycerophosphate/cardiolipin synthase-like enzyme